MREADGGGWRRHLTVCQADGWQTIDDDLRRQTVGLLHVNVRVVETHDTTRHDTPRRLFLLLHLVLLPRPRLRQNRPNRSHRPTGRPSTSGCDRPRSTGPTDRARPTNEDRPRPNAIDRPTDRDHDLDGGRRGDVLHAHAVDEEEGVRAGDGRGGHDDAHARRVSDGRAPRRALVELRGATVKLLSG